MSNNKKIFLYIMGLCIAIVAGVLILDAAGSQQQEEAEVTELYNQCMLDADLSRTVKGSKRQRAFCQCRAEMMHKADMDLMTTREVARDLDMISTSVVLDDITGYETTTEGLANIGSYFYCGMIEEE